MSNAAGLRLVTSEPEGLAVPEPEQLTLFDCGEVDVRELARKRSVFVLKRGRAAETRRGYESDWAGFCAWCRAAGRGALPATDETVSLYLTHLSGKAAPNSLRRYKTSIVMKHRDAGKPSPVGEQTKAVLRAVRLEPWESNAREAVTVEELRRMACAQRKKREPWASRNVALLLVGFASAMRRKELVSLDLESVEFHGRRKVSLHLRKSKTDQQSDGAVIGFAAAKRAELCPVRALRAWLKLRGKEPGPLFLPILPDGKVRMRRLGAEAVYDVVRDAAGAIGLRAEDFGAHSLRAGMITEALNAGKSELAIMSRTLHKNVGTLAKYYRRRSAFSVDPLAGVL